MNATSESLQAVVDTGVAYPAIASLEAADGEHQTVTVRWATGKRKGHLDRVDLSPLISTHRFYAPLRNNSALFETVHLVENGYALAWGDDAIDMAAASVERLAEEAMTGADFCKFLEKHSLTHQAAAAVLGRSKRQIEYYLQYEQIPRVVALACIGYEARYPRKGATAAHPHLAVMPAAFVLMRNPMCLNEVYGDVWNAPSTILKIPNLFNAKFEKIGVANTGWGQPTYLLTDIVKQERRHG
jgi:hypothetical protein